MALELGGAKKAVPAPRMASLATPPVSPTGSAAQAFEIIMGESARKVGLVTEDKRLVITGLAGEVIVDSDLKELKEAWQSPLRFEEVL